MGDEDIAGDLADVLEEGEVQILVLQPGELQVAVHVSAVGVAVAQVAVVMLGVAHPGHAAGRAEANWKGGRQKEERSYLCQYVYFPKHKTHNCVNISTRK